MERSADLQAAKELLRLDEDKTLALWQTLGYSLLLIQTFEDVLAHYLVLVFRIAPGAAAEQAYAALDQARGQTMGRLISDLRKRAALSADTAALLKEMLAERNWMVHRLQHENGNDVYDDAAFVRLLQRIQDVGKRAVHLSKEFGRLIEEWTMRASGVTQQEIDAATLQRVKATRAGAGAETAHEPKGPSPSTGSGA